MSNLVRRLIALLVEFVFRKKPIYVVYGMRRSGSHALVQWLANSIEERETPFRKDPDFWPLKQTDSGDTIFINEVNMIPPKLYLGMLLRRRRLIRTCKTVIISVEDVPSSYVNYRIPKPTYLFYAHRSLLNVIASRLHTLQRQAAAGFGWSRQNVDMLFFNRIKTWADATRFKVWEYEKWLSSSSYRRSFLESIQLAKDLVPGENEELEELSGEELETESTQSNALERYKQVQFPDWIFEQLRSSDIQDLLSPEEKDFMDEHFTVRKESSNSSDSENS